MPLPVRYGPAPGPDDFRSLRQIGNYYVDKTPIIAELLARPDQVLLLPRPRRFGKSLNLSTLRYWFERGPDHSALFEGLWIEGAPEEIRATRGRYPVISLGLKDARGLRWESTLGLIRTVIGAMCATHRDLPTSSALSADDQAALGRLNAGTASEDELTHSLWRLSAWLHAHHGEPAVILIDEYDAPIEAGSTHGYYDEVVGFMRALLGAAFKSNPHLYRGVLTGVRRIAKESLFSGLNNVRVCSMLEPAFSSAFGFTEAEVAQILRDVGRADRLEEVRAWYNGYLWGGREIYNPWSVLCYAQDGVLRPYWVNTSSNALLEKLVPMNGAGLRGAFAALLEGGAVEAEIDEQVALRDIDDHPELLWSFLLTAGYLKALDARWEPDGHLVGHLAIPNREVRVVWRDLFALWLERGLGGSRADTDQLLNAVLAGDAALVEEILGELVERVLSFHDTAQPEPERVYQAFVLGMMVRLEPRYRVRSNRESGRGRADVLLLPRQPGQPGVVMELKRLRKGEAPEAALAAAHDQINERGYASELHDVGASPIHRLAVVFRGKEVWVRGPG